MYTLILAQMVKHLPTMWETQVRSLGWEDPLEKEMATHSSTLAWKIPWTEECCRLQSMGLQRVRHDWATSLSPFNILKSIKVGTTDLYANVWLFMVSTIMQAFKMVCQCVSEFTFLWISKKRCRWMHVCVCVWCREKPQRQFENLLRLPAWI